MFCILMTSVVIIFFMTKHNRSKEEYTTEFNGKVESLRYIGRGEGYLQVKFEEEKEFNPLCVIYVGSDNKEALKIGDSIYKAKNSKDYQIYRRNDAGNYVFYKTLGK